MLVVLFETDDRETIKNGLQERKKIEKPSCDVYFCVFCLFFKEMTLKVLFSLPFPFNSRKCF